MLAPSLGGLWCENFESGAGNSWSRSGSSGIWQHTTYTEESKAGDVNMPKPTTGEVRENYVLKWTEHQEKNKSFFTQARYGKL